MVGRLAEASGRPGGTPLPKEEFCLTTLGSASISRSAELPARHRRGETEQQISGPRSGLPTLQHLNQDTAGPTFKFFLGVDLGPAGRLAFGQEM
jgi:hypothetical protein